MFNMTQVGRRIAEARKARNMTQMALADAMGVSFQAVSNWERGQSMPDIAKLPELSQLLGLSVDALLSGEKSAALVEHILEGDAEAYIRGEALPLEAVADVAPLLPPRQAESFSETVLNREEKPLRVKDLARIAPFVDDDFLDKWVLRVADVDDLGAIIPLAPFLSEEALDALVDKCAAEKINLTGLSALAPFLSEDTLDRLVDSCTAEAINLPMLTGLAPCLSEKALDALVAKLTEEKIELSALTALAPFLSEKALDGLVNRLTAEKINLNALTKLAPFLSEKALDALATRVLAEDGAPSDLASLAPFLPNKTLRAFAEQWVKAHGFEGLAPIIPFL